MADLTGQTISHYRILEKIGQGGMGVVYKAEDTKLKRTVALKLLLPEALGTEEEKERFMREAQAAAALDHPNICTVHAIDEVDGERFMAMAYIDGQSLRSKTQERPLDLALTMDVALQIAQGLQEAHENGIVHRDMKSENVMITGKGQVKIMDFGLAKRGGQALLTTEGTSMGTTAYMSPEQSRGEAVDHRTDIWSFGVILYEMISGQLPFRGDYEQAIVYSIMNEMPEPLTAIRTGVPMDLERIVNKAMAKSPAERYQRMDDLIIDLKAVQRSIEAASGATAATASGIANSALSADSVTSEMSTAPQHGSVIGTPSGLGPPAGTTPAQEAPEDLTLVQELFKRRVPQIVGLYLAVSFGVIQFVDWLVNKYPISPNLPEFSFVALASMLPTVLLLAYFHGKPGRDSWTRFEKLGIPLNLIGATALLFLLFQDKELGATTQKVTITDESGQSVERAIPKSEFRKRIAMFYFSNDSQDPGYDWLQYGLPSLLDYDLDQDLLMGPMLGWSEDLKKAGYEDAVGAPLSLMQRIANENHLTYFITGSFDRSGNQFEVTTKLYESKNAKLITEIKKSGQDLFAIVDSLSVKIKQGLEIPKYHLDQVNDLPIAEISTQSLEALRLFATGYMERVQNNDHAMEASQLTSAVEVDPTFALANYRLYAAHVRLNQRVQAEQAISSAMRHKHKLPTKYLLSAKSAYFNVNQQPEQALDNALNWVKLYPSSIEGYHVLATIYANRNQFNEAEANHRLVYEVDPRAHGELMHIGNMLQLKGDFDAALSHFQQYADRFPQEIDAFVSISALHQIMGDYEAAKSSYKQALLIEPEEISLFTGLARIEILLGNFSAARDQFDRALRMARTPQDSNSVYLGFVGYYSMRGQIRLALAAYDEANKALAKYSHPLALLNPRFQSMALMVQVGREKEALRLLDAMAAEGLTPPFDLFPSLGYLMVYMELEDTENAEIYMQKFSDFLEASRLQVLESILSFAKGVIQQQKKDYEAAVPWFEKALSQMRADQKTNLKIPFAACLREKGDLDRAEKVLNEVLAVQPFQPMAFFEMAMVYEARGNREKATEYLNQALGVWEEADENFKYAKKARETAAEWGLATSL